ncbi:MAG: DUF2442 domain-containing protein [Cyanobacteria bacterium REEB65]|nr:DUF2442 domain-containing protein [Cyanobacteria bacterium REEB65]
MARIVAASPGPDYLLWLRFSDGVEGTVDLSRLVGKGVFESWRDESVFRAVAIEPTFGTVVWPGDIDLCPDALYSDVTGLPLGASAS